MLPESIEKLKQAESFLAGAAGLLDSVASVEWEKMADSDCKTEAQIDEIETISAVLRNQRASVVKLIMDDAIDKAARQCSNAMRMLADD